MSPGYSQVLGLDERVGADRRVLQARRGEGLKLDGPTLAKIFTAKVRTWDDASIAALNAAQAARHAHHGVPPLDASGTTTNFSKYGLRQPHPGLDPRIERLAAVVSSPRADSNRRSRPIKGKSGAIGCVDLSDAKSDEFASIKNTDGEFVRSASLRPARPRWPMTLPTARSIRRERASTPSPRRPGSKWPRPRPTR